MKKVQITIGLDEIPYDQRQRLSKDPRTLQMLEKFCNASGGTLPTHAVMRPDG